MTQVISSEKERLGENISDRTDTLWHWGERGIGSCPSSICEKYLGLLFLRESSIDSVLLYLSKHFKNII